MNGKKNHAKAGMSDTNVGVNDGMEIIVVQDGWSVPVLECEKMTAAPGACFASAEQVQALVKELEHVKFPLGEMTTKEVSGESSQSQCAVTN